MFFVFIRIFCYYCVNIKVATVFIKHLKNKTVLFKILFLIILFSPLKVMASITDGTILSGSEYAWGENVGWINLGTVEGDVHITNTAVTGYMWDSIYGWVNLSPTGSGVVNNGEGVLSGFAWSAGAGFIDFSGVTINTSGKFTGQAQGAIYGRINFDCSTCNVVTDWRPASMQRQNVAVGPISIFISSSTNSRTIEEIPQYFEGEDTPKPVGDRPTIKKPTKQDDITSNQPVISTEGLPMIKTPTTGRSFVTGSTTQNLVNSDIFVLFGRLFKFIYNLLLDFISSNISKIFLITIGFIILFLILFLYRKIKNEKEKIEDSQNM